MKARRVALAKKTKKKKEEEEIPEAWLLPYSDLLTLLLALFIVLFAMSSVDAQKMAALSQVFNEVFDGGQGVMDNPSPTEPMTPKTTEVTEQVQAYMKDQAELSNIQDDVENYIAVNELENQFSTEMTDDGLLITIRDSVLFESGAAEIGDKNIKVAKDLSKLLIFDKQRPVMVTGYTDNIPAQGGKYDSNWELSVMRAVNFLSVLINTNDKLDPKYFSAKGYGENNPIASNKTEAGREKNRRVEVLIQPLVEKDGTKKEVNIEADATK